MVGSLEHLPEDLVTEIMSWLPPESLLRLKIVNKSLYNLIDGLIKDEKFVAKHLRNSKSKASSLLFKAIVDDESGNTNHHRSSSPLIGVRGSLALSINGDDDDCSLGFAIDDFAGMLVMPSGERAMDWYPYVSHCNGILSMFDTGSNMFILLNPATRESKLLPNLCLPNKDQSNKLIVSIAFGYDPVDHVYKLLVQILVPSSGAKRRRGKVRVCSDFGHNSWRKIKWPAQICNDVSEFSTRRKLYLKGVYYWLVLQNHVNIRIHAFDMHAEEFYSVPLPDNFPSKEEVEGLEDDVVVEAIEWKESLALVSYSHTMQKPIEIWTSTIGGFSTSSECYWTKTLSIEVGEIFCCPVAFWKSDEFLMIDGDDHLVSYNVRTKKVVRSARETLRLRVMGNYAKSLVSIKRLNTN